MRSVGQYIFQFRGHEGTPLLNELMIFVAEYLVYLIPIALLYLWFSSEEGKSKSVFIFVTIIVSLAISYAMGQFYAHPAPYSAGYETLITEAPENSFPSQHTTVVFAFTWPVFYLQDRWRDGLVVLAFASLVGISRVYIGVHYPIDIAGAIGASLLGFVLVYAARNVIMDFASLCVNIEERGVSVLRSLI
jgi:undecaprenyl-diphosphatase